MPHLRGYTHREWLLGAGILLAMAIWLALTGLLLVSFYARDAVLDALGPFVMAALAVVSLLPLVCVVVYADRVRGLIRDRSL